VNPPTTSHTPHDEARVKELVEEIVRLSTKWGILTEYTAFLATEPSAGDLARALEQSRGGGGQVAVGLPMEASRREAEGMLRLRASIDRAGVSSVNQEENLNYMKSQTGLNRKNVYWTAEMKKAEASNVCQVTDCTMFNRAGCWVDSRLVTREEIKPDETIDYGTEAFDKLLTKMIAQNRQAMLALGGELYLWDDGRCLLVRGPDVAGVKQ
jgi:hypothetical protein